MIKKYLLFILPIILTTSCSDQQQQKADSFSVKDDLGNFVSFIRPPQRIITLAPNLTEMIYDLGLGKELVGNTSYCNYPDSARKVEKVGDMLTFNFEKILTLKPDVVFITVEGNTKETYNKFLELGIKIFVSNPRNFWGIKKTYLDLGKIFGIEEKAKRKVAAWDSIITNISFESKKHSERTAMFLIDTKPIMLAGRNTFINEYLDICGLKNIAAGSPLNYPMFSREEILKQNPDYIIYPAGNNEDFSNVIKIYPEWKNLKAVKNHNVLLVDRDLFARPGPRFAEAVGKLFSLLHQKAK